MMDISIQLLLATRKSMFTVRDLFQSTPEWDDDSEDANWRVYHKVHHTYTTRRAAFLERRRLERTAAALAAAEAEAARLRATLAKFIDDTNDVELLLINVLAGFELLKRQDTSGQYTLDDVKGDVSKARRALSAKAVVARAALNQEATHENG